MTLLALILLLCPVRLTPPVDLPLREICRLLELAGPREDFTNAYIWGGPPVPLSRADQLTITRSRWRELRTAPVLAAAMDLPEHDACSQMESFFGRRIRCIEAQRKLFGNYRWCDFDPALELAQEQRKYWAMAEQATDAHERWADRRRALAWIRDN